MSKPFPHAIKYDRKVRHLSVIDNGPDYAGVRYMARAHDKKAGQYLSEVFPTIPECVSWGTRKIAEFTVDVSRAGQVILKEIAPKYLASLVDCKPKTVREIKNILDGLIKAGCTDLKDKVFIEKAQAFFDGLKNKRPRKVKLPDGQVKVIDELSVDSKYRYVGHGISCANWCMTPANQPIYGLPYNPFEAVNRKSVNYKRVKTMLLFEELQRLVSDEALAMPEGLYWAIRLWLGGRYLEMAWLRADHINWAGERVKILEEDNFDRAEVARLDKAREGYSYRGPHPGKVAHKELKSGERNAHMPKEMAETLAKMTLEGRQYLFSDEIRGRSNKADVRAWRRHCRALGIKTKVNPHCLRNSNGSLLVAAGMSMPMLLSHMGHSSEQVNLKYTRGADVYGVVAKDWDRQIRLRSNCEKTVIPRLPNGSLTLAEPAPEDDIDDLEIVLLPDDSPVFTDKPLPKRHVLTVGFRASSVETSSADSEITCSVSSFNDSDLDAGDWCGS